MLYLWYDIYLLQLGFHPVAVVDKLVKKNMKETAVYKRRNEPQSNTKNTEYRK